ncbi:MAG: cytochrome c family protein [Thermodesulfobacteriota bacterium]
MGLRHNILSLALFATVIISFYEPALATGLEKFIMPGPLAKAHQKYEKDCQQCHDPLDYNKQKKQCLACHKEVAADVSGQTGFHGRNPRVLKQECRYCHGEHRGREAGIVPIDPDVFDHSLADFPLRDSHTRVQCGQCHVAGKKFREAQGKCVVCHKQQEPHMGNLGEECDKCHRETSWRAHVFNHGNTRFLLEGKHSQIRCIACHLNQKWKGLPLDCAGCHRTNDIHGGQFGSDCKKCHSPIPPAQPVQGKTAWYPAGFDHGKTRFPLVGKHAPVGCRQCHDPAKPLAIGSGKPIPVCVECHSGNDVHRGRFGNKCQQCHAPEGWQKQSFDHAKTRFPLKARHRDLPCSKCHTKERPDKDTPLTCAFCHTLDDPHRGVFGGECEKCHSDDRKWQEATFDHEKTKFPLRDKHVQVKCRPCHDLLPREKTSPATCVSCHGKNDPHKGKEGERCDKCHNLKGWRTEVFFDHDLTDFPLIGMHTVPPCEGCHIDPVFKNTPGNCSGCHDKKDPHKKRFGDVCQSCHTPNGWKFWSFDHSSQANFPLEGAHAGLDCLACHILPLAEKKLPRACNDCHSRIDPHRGRFGAFCDRCHVTDSFKKLKMSR